MLPLLRLWNCVDTAEQFAAYGSNIAPHQTELPTAYSTNYLVAKTE
jgi:hypothetical protein